MNEAVKTAGQSGQRFFQGFATAGLALGCLVILAALAVWAIPALGGPSLPSPFRMFESGVILVVICGLLQVLLRTRGSGR